MADFALQRKNMVESQVRPSDVTDRRILRAMQDIPREAFVPAARQAIAYMDDLLPLGTPTAGRPGRALLAPRVLAKLIQALELEDTSRVLVVGAATGYSTAVIARIARTVVGIEPDAALAETARAALKGVAAGNATIEAATGNGLPSGWAKDAPYDAILVDGAVSTMPPALLDQLKDGGRLAAVRQDDKLGRATLWRRLGGTFDAQPLFDAGAPILPGFARTPEFVF